jgi:hypothetical protein
VSATFGWSLDLIWFPAHLQAYLHPGRLLPAARTRDDMRISYDPYPLVWRLVKYLAFYGMTINKYIKHAEVLLESKEGRNRNKNKY